MTRMSSYADRLKALREQLKADRLDGFVVPLTDEHMSEYVGSYAQRLAWLTGFEGSAGSAVVLPQEAAIFVDGRYTLAGPQPGRRQGLVVPVGPGDQRRRLAEGACAAGRADRLRPVAPQPRLGEEGERGARQPRRRAGRGRAEPDRQGLGGPARSVEGASRSSSRKSTPADRPPTKRRRSPTGSCRRRPTRRCCRRSIRSPGRSMSAVRTCRGRRSRWRLRWCTRTAPPTCSSNPEKITPRCSQHLGNGVRLHDRNAFEGGARRA